jgi:hypothetical protein
MPPVPRNSAVNDYEISVFINCPFDAAYKRLFNCVVFTTIYCGFRARCSLEIDDGSQIRIEKIFGIIEQCRLGIHDLSRTQLDKAHRLPRFNMPLELGMFLGAKRYGGGVQRQKQCLILDRDLYRYQKFVSDIAGQDIRSHDSNGEKAVTITRDWLRSCSSRPMPGGTAIHKQYQRFVSRLPAICRDLRLKSAEMTFNDYTNIVAEWLKADRYHLILRKSESLIIYPTVHK